MLHAACIHFLKHRTTLQFVVQQDCVHRERKCNNFEVITYFDFIHHQRYRYFEGTRYVCVCASILGQGHSNDTLTTRMISFIEHLKPE